jgi:hypothetical protein
MERHVAVVTQRNESVDPTGRNTRNPMKKVTLAVARAEARDLEVGLEVTQVDVAENPAENLADIQVVGLEEGRVALVVGLEEGRVALVADLEEDRADIQAVEALQTKEIVLGIKDVESK